MLTLLATAALAAQTVTVKAPADLRALHSMCTFPSSGQVLMLGGWVPGLGSDDADTTARLYDVPTDSWSAPIDYESAPHNIPRRMRAGLVYVPTLGVAVLFGGERPLASGSLKHRDTVFVAPVPGGLAFSGLAGVLVPQAMLSPAACWDPVSQLVVAHSDGSRDTCVFDPIQKVWAILPNTLQSPLGGGATMLAVDGEIVLVNAETPANTYKFDRVALAWVSIGTFTNHNYGAAMYHAGYLWSVAGIVRPGDHCIPAALVNRIYRGELFWAGPLGGLQSVDYSLALANWANPKRWGFASADLGGGQLLIQGGYLDSIPGSCIRQRTAQTVQVTF